MQRKFHGMSISAAVLFALMSAAQVADAQAIAQFDLPAQPLGDSLRAVARQTNTNVLFDRALVNGRTAPALKAQASADAALRELLAGSGLRTRFVDEKTVVLESADDSRAGSNGQFGNSIATSQADLLQQSSGAYPTGPSRIRLAQVGGGAVGAGSIGSQGTRENIIELEEIVVIGSHIRGLENGTVPVTVLDRSYIESTGKSTTTALIESLPQNFALTSQSGVIVPGAGSSSSREQGASINLRAVGEGTTLVLLNGRRMAPGSRSAAVDISALPLSAIERVEILTDGASALYGSDAVGGVVNFILRNDFEGAETRLRSGWADGVDELRLSQVFGNAWSSGNALLSMEYYQRDLLRASARDFVPSTSIIGSLYPEDENYSAMFSVRQELSGALSLFADGLYTQRDSYNEGGRTTLNSNADTDNRQIAATFGVDWQLGGDWQMELAASYADNDLNQLRNDFSSSMYDSLFEIRAAQVKADGPLFEWPGGSVRMAIGAEWRSESFEETSVDIPSGFVILRGDSDQTVRGAFTELYVPIVGEANARAGINRLDLSLAGRFDEYSSAGSSFDPQVGIMWEPVRGLRLRGSHGTSYKAPNLVDYSVSTNSAIAAFLPDPASPTGSAHLLQLNGIDTLGMSPQESESSSFGLQWGADGVQGPRLGVNYYRIEYTEQIANPPLIATVVLGDPSAFGDLFVRDPSAALVNEYIALGQLGQGFFAFNPDFTPNTGFTPDSVDVVVDLRRRNLSVVKTSGLDLSFDYDVPVVGGNVRFGLAGTYILELEHQITSTSEPFETVDTFYNPPDWRVRGSFGWQRHGWATTLFVNHTDSYTDNRAAAPVPVPSYTTVDARLAYDFRQRFSDGFLSGVVVSASVQNLLDEDPPHTTVLADFSDMGFDPTNANPIGRLVALEISKSW